MRGHWWHILVVACCIALTGLGCNLTRETVVLTPQAGTTPQVTATDGWLTVDAGIAWRELKLPVSGASAVLVRLDPKQVSLRVHHSPGEPRSLGEWRDTLSGARVVVNGAFFDETDTALGLLISDGQVTGQSFSGFGGMLQVGTDGTIRVRSLVNEPYRGEALNQAVQGFPMLIELGGVLAPRGDGFDNASRRTFVAQDRAGYIILGVVSQSLISLAELQDDLLASDLNLHVAVGLDGGRSTGLVLRTLAEEAYYPAVDRLPSVIAAY